MRLKFLGWLRRIWRIVQHVEAIWSLIGLLGFVVPLAVGLIAGVLAYMQSLPPLLIFLGMVGGYALAILGVNQTDALRKRIRNQGQATPIRKHEAVRMEHDGVLWEDTGKRYAFSDEVLVRGPLCPKDYCPLGLRHRNGHEEVRADGHDDGIVSASSYHAILFCPECKATYTLGEKPKQLGQSRKEVESRFEGLHRRNADA